MRLQQLRDFWRGALLVEKAVFIAGALLLPISVGHEYSISRQPALPPLFRQSPKLDEIKTLRIHVSGAVKKPALLTLPLGARVVDAVRQAGATSQADANALNLAAPLRDGQKIIVPTRGVPARDAVSNRVLDVAPSRVAKTQSDAPATQKPLRILDINTASPQELESLPGVGPAIAARIVEERAKKPFVSLQDLDRVKGIGVKKLQKIAPYVTF